MNDAGARFRPRSADAVSSDFVRTNAQARSLVAALGVHSSARLNARDALRPRATTATPGSPARARSGSGTSFLRSLATAARRASRAPCAARVGDVERPPDGDGHRGRFTAEDLVQSERAETRLSRRAASAPWLFAATLRAQRSRRAPRSTQRVARVRRACRAAIPSYAVSGEPAVRAVHGETRPGRPRGPLAGRGARVDPAGRAPRLPAAFAARASLSLSLAHELTHALTRALTPLRRSRCGTRDNRSAPLHAVPALFPPAGTRCAAWTRRGARADVSLGRRRRRRAVRGGSGARRRLPTSPRAAGVALSDNAGSD